jgi:hypothetical protein
MMIVIVYHALENNLPKTLTSYMCRFLSFLSIIVAKKNLRKKFLNAFAKELLLQRTNFFVFQQQTT